MSARRHAALPTGGLLAVLVAVGPAAAEPYAEVLPEELIEPPVTSPYAFRDFPDRVLFGDMHIHSNLSPDAGLLGTSLTAADVYRAARGETVMSNTGQPFRLVRPLDFLVLTDHAEAMGLAPMMRESNPLLLSSERGRQVYEGFNGGPEAAVAAFGTLLADLSAGIDPFADIDMAGSIWPEFVELADRYDQPGVFTAMTGFEWTSQPSGNNLHRIVVFADGADKTSRVRPFSALDGQDPAMLWDYMEAYEELTGGRVFAHVHNGNLSNGIAFTAETFDGTPMDADYAARRSRWEPIMEITQIKGDGETHPFLSPDDEFADFERWDVGNLDGSTPKTPDMLRYEYARSALLTGLEVEAATGANPYDFGFNGTTDSHTGLASSGENNFFGKFAGTEPGPGRLDKVVIPSADPTIRIVSAQESASGLTGVWARENTRDEIFDAMLRKEIFATTGTRMRVRLFAGWDFGPGDELVPDFSGLGYRKGVPMGGCRNAPIPRPSGIHPKAEARRRAKSHGAAPETAARPSATWAGSAKATSPASCPVGRLFARREPDLPDPAALRRHAPPHRRLARRGRGGARLTPSDAYRFARGEQITASSGQPVKLTRPLDFLVVADHSDNMGFFPALSGGDPTMLADPTGRRWYDLMNGRGHDRHARDHRGDEQRQLPRPRSPSRPDSPMFRDAWTATIDAAETYNDPGRFTAFIGYEWTSQAAFNIHRNVIYRDGGDLARQVLPFTVAPPLGSPRDSDLWKWMEAYEEKTGGDVLAIAHNGNVSNGLMFPTDPALHGPPRRPGLCRGAGEVGAGLRGHADEGRRRDASVPVAQRRVRRLRDLGQGQPEPERSQDARDAAP
jgi:hypothetical protein